jgi:hypothetical protein
VPFKCTGRHKAADLLLTLRDLRHRHRAGFVHIENNSSQRQAQRRAAIRDTATQDDVEAKLTPGQKKAVTDAKKLRTDGAAIYNEDGKKVKEGSSKNLAYEFKACKDPKSISDRCWVCKDGRIFCKIPASQSK